MTRDDEEKSEMPVGSLADLSDWWWDQKKKEAEGNPVKLMEIEARIVALEVASQEKQLQRMLDILEKHNIPRDHPEKWFYLALKLAMVSGEFFARPRGAPKKWTDDWYAILIYMVVHYRLKIAKEKGCAYEAVTVIAAIRRLIKDNPGMWASEGGKVNAHSLQKRHNEALAQPHIRRLAVEKARPAQPTEK